MKIIISEQNAGKTVFDILKWDIGISSRMLTRLKKSDTGILVNGEHVTVRRILLCGDELEVESEREVVKERAIEPCNIPIDVIYEDEDIIAVNKPCNMPTHPSHGHYTDTLANALAWYYRDRDFTFRAVSRLDRDTSGVVVVAKNQLSAARLSKSHINGEIKKTYLAVLQGELEGSGGVIEGYIRRLDDGIIKRGNFESGAESEYAKTLYRVVGVGGGVTAVLVRPVTGRTHQIRVHFSSMGYSLEGDEIYGGSHDKIARQALHAVAISFPHPSSRKTIDLTAKLPHDMLEICENFDISDIHDFLF